MDIGLLKSGKVKKIHFTGIGGISMSGLAEILSGQGYTITGSDQKASDITENLRKSGISVYIGHSEKNLEAPDLVVYTAAVKEDNPELIAARALNIPVVERAVLLGHIMEKFPMSIAVSGTHGKTTTTSMISVIMLEAKLDPTLHIGGRLDIIEGTVRTGNSRYFVTEACEYVESFLKLYPFLEVFLNIELDHIDYFKDINHVKQAFYKFGTQVKPGGCIVACIDDPNVVSVLEKLSCKKITYGLKAENAEWTARDIIFNEKGCASFTLMRNGAAITNIELNVPGLHNISNSIAAAAACVEMGCDITAVRNGLNTFHGAQRRFEFKGEFNGIKVIDDYAHHPSEVKATLRAAGSSGFSKIWCVFQPHTYSRTKSFLEDFAEAFEDANTVLLADIYAAREPNTGEIHSSMLEQKINKNVNKAIYMPVFTDIAAYLKQNAAPGDVVITMGAGDISKVGDILLES